MKEIKIVLVGTEQDRMTEKEMLELVASRLVQVQKAEKVTNHPKNHRKSHKKFTPYCWLGVR